MLPVINLDDQNFRDIFEEARKMISGLYPHWTDYNEHDPGITFLELFSWFKEMQQFHLNQVGPDNYLMYLKLLGMRQLNKVPADTLVTFSGISQGFRLAKGSRLYAGDICFETDAGENLDDIRIIDCISRCKFNEAKVDEAVVNSGSYMKFSPFGEQPEQGDEFIIKFDLPFEIGVIHSIYFKIFEDYPVKRNPISGEEFIPLARLSVQYFCSGSWRQCQVEKDETFGFIQSGKLYFSIDQGMQEAEGGFCLRIKLEECNYEVPPVLQEISLNTVKAVQRSTSSEYEDFAIEKTKEEDYEVLLDSYLAVNGYQEVYLREKQGFVKEEGYTILKEDGRVFITFRKLFDGRTEDSILIRVINYSDGFEYKRCHEMNGFPYQSIDLEDYDILYESLEILAEDEFNPGYYEQWEKVDNFSCSSPSDRHYVFDDGNGVLLFGDSENGKAPEGKLVLIGYADSLGIKGNVKEGQINRFADNKEEIKVLNKNNAVNGRDKETVEACFKRFLREFRKIKRAVTNEDYEQIIRSTPGLMIENVKTIPVNSMRKRDGSIEENCVTAVVQQYSAGKRTALNNAYLDNINRLLDKRRLVGTKIIILSPEYIGISVFIEVAAKPHYINAYDTIRKAVEEYFIRSGSEFGKPVLYSELYGSLDVLDCVAKVVGLTINSTGKGISRSMNQDLILPANGLVYLKEARYTVTSSE